MRIVTAYYIYIYIWAMGGGQERATRTHIYTTCSCCMRLLTYIFQGSETKGIVCFWPKCHTPSKTQSLIETTNIIRANIQYHLYIPRGMYSLLSFRIPYKSTDEAFHCGTWTMGSTPRGLGLWPSSDPTREVIPGHGARSVESPGNQPLGKWCRKSWFGSRFVWVSHIFLDVLGRKGFLISWSKKVGRLDFWVWFEWMIQFLSDPISCGNSGNSSGSFQEVGRRANVRLQDFKQQVGPKIAKKIMYPPGN